MARSVLFLVGCLLAQAFCVPAGSRHPGNQHRPTRADNGYEDREGNEAKETADIQSTSSTSSYDTDDDDDFGDSMQTSSSTGGGSNILSLLNLAAAFFPSASGATEDGQSDLGSLLAAVSGIVGSLSGDGFDLNALIATGFGLFVGLLSEGEENPGSVIASYLLTSLDTITGGGSKNNGAFIGNFLSKLIKGTSAVSDESGSSEENGNKMPPMSDSTGFFVSLLMSLSGDMSKGSSGGSSAWRR